MKIPFLESEEWENFMQKMLHGYVDHYEATKYLQVELEKLVAAVEEKAFNGARKTLYNHKMDFPNSRFSEYIDYKNWREQEETDDQKI